MKKLFILAGITVVAMACNQSGNTHSGGAHSGGSDMDHSSHQRPASDTSKTLSPITQTMDEMMHQMHNAAPTGNIDVDYATMMVAHHQGAVAMSQVIIDKGNDAELKAFAQKLMTDQNKEIALMKEVIAGASKEQSPNARQFQQAMNESMMTMMKEDAVRYANIDEEFAAEMIPHHQSAVEMAQAYLRFGKEGRLRTLSNTIIKEQISEINWLKDWMKRK